MRNKQIFVPLSQTLPINGKPLRKEIAAQFGYGEPNWTDSVAWNSFQLFLYIALGIGIAAVFLRAIA